jgi:hypothetical protein
MQCISKHLQLTLVESALCCSCLEPLFSLGSQTACTACTFSTLPGVIVPGTGSQPSHTASSEQAPIHFTAEKSISGTPPHPLSTQRVCPPPRTKGGGEHTRREVRGWGVNILEDARHWIGLLQYNPSTRYMVY